MEFKSKKSYKMFVNMKRLTRMISINNIFKIEDKRLEGLKNKQHLI